MAVKGQLEQKKKEILCQRCKGRMVFEKFYGKSGAFFGWRCVICGDILDPVILLHRLTQEADLTIPEEEKEMMALLEKYLRVRVRKIRAQVSRSRGKQHADPIKNMNSAKASGDRKAFPAQTGMPGF